MSSYLPPHEGLLPYWLLLASIAAISNSVNSYRSLRWPRQTYASPLAASQVTPFAARVYGTWTFLSAVVRVFAAYRIDDPGFYALTLATFALALTHFTAEWLAFGTMQADKGCATVMLVSGSSVVWMLLQRGFYLG
ncbi:ergosterol biosynthesis protein [Xylographa carneopallida]|nr:ergosterol biosynthesis protein [Xylographa carneopallida]